MFESVKDKVEALDKDKLDKIGTVGSVVAAIGAAVMAVYGVKTRREIDWLNAEVLRQAIVIECMKQKAGD